MLLRHFPRLDADSLERRAFFAAYGSENLVVHATGADVFYAEHPGPLSLRWTVRGMETYWLRGVPLRLEAGRHLVLNPHTRYASEVSPGPRCESLTIFFATGFAERVLAAESLEEERLLDHPEHQRSVRFVENIGCLDASSGVDRRPPLRPITHGWSDSGHDSGSGRGSASGRATRSDSDRSAATGSGSQTRVDSGAAAQSEAARDGRVERASALRPRSVLAAPLGGAPANPAPAPLSLGQRLIRLHASLSSGPVSDFALDEACHGLLLSLLEEQRLLRRRALSLSAVRVATRRELYARVTRARDFLMGASEQPLRLEMLAKVAAMAPHHFLRVFSEAFGTTPGRLLRERRLERAASALAEGDLPVESIAAAVGFESHAAFSRSFRRAFGTTPSAYRASVRRR